MINVGIDDQVFTTQNTGGISRYFASLLSEKNANSGVRVYPMFSRHRNHYLACSGVGEFSDDVLLSDCLKEYAADSTLSASDCDVAHSTYYYGLPCKYKDTPHVVTLYDMIPECYPEFFPAGNPHANKKVWLEQCDSIISISHASADELAHFFPRLRNKISVVHLGFNPISKSSAQLEQLANSANWPRFEYYLYVGSRQGYKNALMLLRAYLASDASSKNIHLIFAGGTPLADHEKSLINESGKHGFVHHLMPSDDDLYLLYKFACAVVVPSLAEGFSLPLVEALHFDAPLVCSEIPVHLEVAAKYAHFVSPALISAWIELLSSPSYLKRPSNLASSRYEALLGYYSVRRMVADHHKIYSALS